MVEKFWRKDAKKGHFSDQMEFRKKSNKNHAKKSHILSSYIMDKGILRTFFWEIQRRI